MSQMFLFVGTSELLLIAALALLLFGGKKLPEMMRGLGNGIRQFKDGMNEESPKDKNSEESPKDKNSEEKIDPNNYTPDSK